MKTILSPCIFCLDEQQRPRRLPCAHSFCSDCLERYILVRRDLRCPLCRREFQVRAGEPAAASNDSSTDPDTHVVPAAMSTTPQPTVQDEDARTSDQFVHLIDIDMLNDTLVLTLTEEEIRLFTELYEGSFREDQRQLDSRDSWIAINRGLSYNFT